jgi:hypothetical protein
MALSPAILGQNTPKAKPSQPTPLMGLLRRFTATNVPAMGPAETEVAPRKWDQPIPPGLPGNGLAEHPMLYIGEGYNKILLVNKGKIIWTYSTGTGWEYDDVWMLSNGNILFSRMQYVAEITPIKQVVWRYDAPEGTEIHTCQPIGLDKVMFVLNGLPPKLMVVNTKTKAVEVQHDLPAPSLSDRGSVHAQFRRARYTAQGTYLIPFLEMGQVVEYGKDFKEVWKYQIPSPWAAIRLKNGNTLITDERDILTREVNPKGETVWELRPGDLPEPYRFINTQSCTRLANGNTIICSRGDDGNARSIPIALPKLAGGLRPGRRRLLPQLVRGEVHRTGGRRRQGGLSAPTLCQRRAGNRALRGVASTRPTRRAGPVRRWRPEQQRSSDLEDRRARARYDLTRRLRHRFSGLSQGARYLPS